MAFFLKETIKQKFPFLVCCSLAFFTCNSPTVAQQTNILANQVATTGFADIVENLLPAVVNISTQHPPISPLASQTKEFEEFKRKAKGSDIGSGFIISDDGFIITNNHVIDSSADIMVNLSDGSQYKAKLIGVDKKTDLALLKIASVKKLTFVTLGDSSKSRIGDWIIVIGNPYGLGGSVSVGIISAISRDVKNGQIDDLIQTDAAINKGNSGGPMFNLNGEVIGVTSSLFSPSGGSVGIGFAIPSSTFLHVIDNLKTSGEVPRGWLGISVQDTNNEGKPTKGAFVTEIAPNGPADKAGILPSDIIINFDGQDIPNMRTLPKIVAKTGIGKTTQIKILRKNKIKILNIKVSKQNP